MDRTEFLQRFFTLFADSFTEKNRKAWSEAYKEVLEPDLDYDKVYSTMGREYSYRSAPTPAWFFERLSKFRKYKSATGDSRFENYIVTKETETSIWVKFPDSPYPESEYECGKP